MPIPTAQSLEITIYTKPDCPFCDKAKGLVGILDMPLTVNYINVASIPQASEFLRNQGLNTVPQVYINGDHIGGYDQFRTWAIQASR